MRLLAAVVFALLASGASAQPDWRSVPDARYVSIDALGTSDSLPLTDRTGALDATADLTYALALISGRVPLASGMSVTATLPFGFSDLRVEGSIPTEINTGSTFGIGNLYVGAIQPIAPEAAVEVGVWLPTSTDDSFLDNREEYNFAVGSAAAATQRDYREIGAKDVLSARVALHGALDVTPAVGVRGVVSPVVSYYTGRLFPGGEDQSRTNLAATGGAFVDGRVGPVTLSLGTTGRYEPNAGYFGGFVDELQANAVGSLALEGLPVRPGVTVQMPVLAKQQSFTDFVVGFSLDLPLR